MDKFKNIFLISLFLILCSCGYKVLNKSNGDYNIIRIDTYGDQRINYKIKNKLQIKNTKSSKIKFNLKINSTKKKIIKNKNIKNVITSYNLTIVTEVSYGVLGKLKEGSFTITQNGDYKVSDQRLNTLNREKSLTESLVNKIIEKINVRLNYIANDS